VNMRETARGGGFEVGGEETGGGAGINIVEKHVVFRKGKRNEHALRTERSRQSQNYAFRGGAVGGVG